MSFEWGVLIRELGKRRWPVEALGGIRMILGGRFGQWRDPLHFGKFFRSGGYFVFLEEGEALPSGLLLDPHGDPIERDLWRGDRVWRFRSSGVASRTFLEA